MTLSHDAFTVAVHVQFGCVVTVVVTVPPAMQGVTHRRDRILTATFIARLPDGKRPVGDGDRSGPVRRLQIARDSIGHSAVARTAISCSKRQPGRIAARGPRAVRRRGHRKRSVRGVLAISRTGRGELHSCRPSRHDPVATRSGPAPQSSACRSGLGCWDSRRPRRRRFPSPVPLPPAVTVIQPPLDAALHEQPAAIDTVTEPQCRHFHRTSGKWRVQASPCRTASARWVPYCRKPR